MKIVHSNHVKVPSVHSMVSVEQVSDDIDSMSGQFAFS